MHIRAAIERILRKEEDDSIAAKILLSPLYIISLLYGVLTWIRIFLYKTALLPSYKLPCKVISIGNITVGGTGKTPMTLYVGKLLKDMGHNVAVLSRGYRGKGEGSAAILSDGEGPLHGPEKSGDEPYLIASKLKSVPVLTGKDRFRTGMLAHSRFDTEIIILDDGYQHLRLKRDLNILLISPKTLRGKGHLLPRGELREPLGSINRADIIMVQGDKDDHLKAVKGLKAVNGPKPFFFFRYNPKFFINLRDGREEKLDIVKGKSLLAVCGIAFPAPFFNTLRELGAKVCKKVVFPDHHLYTQKDVKFIKDASKYLNVIAITEKDGVKLRKILPEELNVYALKIDVEVSEEERFKDYLKSLLLKTG